MVYIRNNVRVFSHDCVHGLRCTGGPGRNVFPGTAPTRVLRRVELQQDSQWGGCTFVRGAKRRGDNSASRSTKWGIFKAGQSEHVKWNYRLYMHLKWKFLLRSMYESLWEHLSDCCHTWASISSMAQKCQRIFYPRATLLTCIHQ